MTDDLVTHVGRGRDVLVVAQAIEQGRFVADLKVDGVDELQFGGFLTRIVAAFEQGEIQQLVAVDAQALYERRAQRVIRVVERQFEFGDS